MKFILYAILAWLIYRYLSRLGRIEEKIDRMSDQQQPPSKKEDKSSGEYIDYEEIK